MSGSASETAAITLVTLSRSLRVGTIIDSSAAHTCLAPVNRVKESCADNDAAVISKDASVLCASKNFPSKALGFAVERGER
jgi:hypothetical protein